MNMPLKIVIVAVFFLFAGFIILSYMMILDVTDLLIRKLHAKKNANLKQNAHR